MSSGGKGGSGKRTVYCGTIAGVLGEGPAHSFRQFLVNAKAVWTGPLLRASAANPTTITLVGYGNAQLFFGTEDQPISTVLSRYGLQPAYRGSVVVVLDDIRFGDSGETNPPNLEVVWRREPDQDIVTVLTADSGFTATIPAHAAELLTSWSWAGLPVSALNVASFAALEAAFAGDPRNAIAPLYSDQCSVRSALADCAAIADAWLRIDPAGKIEVGHWPRGGPSGTVTSFTAEDFTDSPEIEVDDAGSLPNTISVEFRDSSKLHKANATLVPDTAAIRRSGGRVRRQTAKRTMLNTLAAAKRHGADLLASESRPGVVITISVFRPLAVRPDGQRIQPGDYFIAPVQLLPESPAVPRLFRCTRRSFGVRGPIKITGELDRSAPAAAAVEVDEVVSLERVLPPLNWVRIFGAPAGAEAMPQVFAVAARPDDGCTGYDVRYDPDQGGDFPAIGNEPGCALPLRLQASCSSGASEVTVQLLSAPASGANPRRDEHLIRNWSGGLVEGRDDRLLLVLLKIAVDGQIEADGTAEYAEIMSVAGPAAIVAADTFTVPVLRGRKGTLARAFDAGDWSDVEAWLVPAGSLVSQRHADWIAAATAGDTIYFRFRPYALGVEYDGDSANAERQRRAAAEEDLQEYGLQLDGIDTPTVPYRIPAGYLPPGDESNLQPGTYDQLNGVQLLGLPGGSLPVQTSGGMWTLVGHRACDGVVDSPPKRWRIKAYSGAATNRTWNVYPTYPDHPDYYACGESTLHCTTVYELRGQCMYDRDTGIPTNTLENVLTQTGPNCGSPEGEYHSANACDDLLPGVNPGPGTLHTTHTAQWYTLSGVCTYSYPVLTGSIVTGEIRVDLSDEDTDEDAVRRMLLTSPAWGTTYTTAIWTVRTDGITGLYREIRHRTEHTEGDPAETLPTLTGLNPRQRYRLTVWLASRPVDSAGTPTGTGEWAADGTREYLFETDADGKGGIDWQTIEPKQGYETYIADNLVEVY